MKKQSIYKASGRLSKSDRKASKQFRDHRKNKNDNKSIDDK